MKRFLMSVIIFLLIMSAIAENKENIIPDRSIWGISRGELKKLYDMDFIECKVGGKKCLMTSNIIIGSYNMNVYYVFGEIMIDSKGLTYSGLTKIAYILDDEDKRTKEEINQCYETLVSSVEKEAGKPDSIAKAVTTWNGEGYKIEVGKGKFGNYTGSKKTSTAILVTGVDIPILTFSSQSVIKLLGLSDSKIDKDFSLQNGAIKYGMSKSDVMKFEKKNKSKEITDSVGVFSSSEFTDKIDYMTEDDASVTYYFDHDKLISIGYDYGSEIESKDVLTVLEKKYGEPVPSDNRNGNFVSLLKQEKDYYISVMNWGEAQYQTGNEHSIFYIAQWQLQFDDCYVVIDLFELDETYGIYGYEKPHVGYRMYSVEALQTKYAALVEEINKTEEEQEEKQKKEQKQKKKMLDQL